MSTEPTSVITVSNGSRCEICGQTPSTVHLTAPVVLMESGMAERAAPIFVQDGRNTLAIGARLARQREPVVIA